MSEKIRIAVIGVGYWGRNLVRNYYELGVLKLICDNNDAVLERIKKQYPKVDLCFAFSDVLSRQDIDGIVIATPAEKKVRFKRVALPSEFTKHVGNQDYLRGIYGLTVDGIVANTIMLLKKKC